MNRKSQMVAEAVEEVLELVHKATQIFKKMMGDDADLIMDGKYIYKHSCKQ